MPLWLQNSLVLTVILACGYYLARRVWKSLNAKNGCGGSCNCGSRKESRPASTQPLAFVPLEMLARKKSAQVPARGRATPAKTSGA